MKKLFALFLMLIVMTSSSFAEGIISPILLIPSYVYFAECFGAEEMPSDINFGDSSGETSLMSCNNLDVIYDTASFKTLLAALLYGHADQPNVNDDLQALGFFAAVEYGAPIDRDAKEISDARSYALPILTKMKSVIKNDADRLKSGEYIPFYVGENAVFTIVQFGNVIMVTAE